MTNLNERVAGLEIATRYESRAREQDHGIIMAHSKRLHHAEAAIQTILVAGARRDRKLGHLEAIAAEAKRINDRVLFVKAAGKYMIGSVVIALFLSGKLSGEQVAVIRAWFTGI